MQNLLNAHETERIHSTHKLTNFIKYDFWGWGLSVWSPYSELRIDGTRQKDLRFA